MIRRGAHDLLYYGAADKYVGIAESQASPQIR
jgi:predicted GH43/DUF377 family glycosyl hydrolase